MSGLNLFNTASSVPVFSCDIRHDVLVEELQNEGDAVGKDQMLSHVLKLRDKSDSSVRGNKETTDSRKGGCYVCGRDLVDVVEFEVFQEQQQDGRDGLHDDLLVSIDVDAEFHALQHCGPATKTSCLSP